MNSKRIDFDYKGGKYTQNINIQGTNLPWNCECDVDWITFVCGATSVTFTVEPTYNFKERFGNITITDRFDNELVINVHQEGFMDLSVECAKSVVLYHSYYKQNPYFDAYVTVYGGEHQEPVCEALEKHITQVWDNSELYNDYVIRIPQELSGTFEIEHKDTKEFVAYCQKHKFPLDLSKIIKTITITQVSTDDVIGNMKIEIDGIENNCGDKPVVYIDSKKWIDINIISTAYTHVQSNTKYEIIDNRQVDVQNPAYWVAYTNKTGLVTIKATEPNTFSDRENIIRLVNRTNAHQYIDIRLIQKTK